MCGNVLLLRLVWFPFPTMCSLNKWKCMSHWYNEDKIPGASSLDLIFSALSVSGSDKCMVILYSILIPAYVCKSKYFESTYCIKPAEFDSLNIFRPGQISYLYESSVNKQNISCIFPPSLSVAEISGLWQKAIDTNLNVCTNIVLAWCKQKYEYSYSWNMVPLSQILHCN